jgi:hypothetical protein
MDGGFQGVVDVERGKMCAVDGSGSVQQVYIMYTIDGQNNRGRCKEGIRGAIRQIWFADGDP